MKMFLLRCPELSVSGCPNWTKLAPKLGSGFYEKVGTSFAGVIFNGIAAWDYTGEAISLAGDVDGDGLSDLLIGANQATSPNGNRSGQTHLIYAKGIPVTALLTRFSLGSVVLLRRRQY